MTLDEAMERVRRLVAHQPGYGPFAVKDKEALRLVLDEVERLKATHPKFAVSSVDYHQRCGAAPAEAIRVLEELKAQCDEYEFVARAVAAESRVRALEDALRAVELCVDGLNTKAFRQKPETQTVLDRIKRHCHAALGAKP
jgi:hypothetical protein